MTAPPIHFGKLTIWVKPEADGQYSPTQLSVQKNSAAKGLPLDEALQADPQVNQVNVGSVPRP